MTSRTPMDAAFLETRDRGTEGLAMFADPDIRTAAPVAPGSSSSERGAESVAPFMKGMRREIILSLAAVTHPISREELSARTGIKESTLCPRLYELRPLWVEVVPDACTSSAGVTVDGYTLTDSARRRALRSA